MLSIEERETIEYLKSRLYGNEGCKFIDVAQSDLRIFLKLVEKLQKNFTLKNNKICDLEFIIEKQIEEMKRHIDFDNECEIAYISKIKNLEKEIEELKEKNKILEAISLSFNEIQDRDKKWKDKIKAKIEEVDKDENASIPDFIEYAKEYAKEYATQNLQSLLEKE